MAGEGSVAKSEFVAVDSVSRPQREMQSAEAATQTADF